jgi:hypothetical protein
MEKAVDSAAAQAVGASEPKRDVAVAPVSVAALTEAAAASMIQRWLRQRQAARRTERAEAEYRALALVAARKTATGAESLRAAVRLGQNVLKVQKPQS